MKLRILLCALITSVSCLAETTNIVRFDDVVPLHQSPDQTSTIVLTKPNHDMYPIAGTKGVGQFLAENVVGPVEIRLVKSLGNGAVDMNVQFPIGVLNVAKPFGKNKFMYQIPAHVPVQTNGYGMFLFAHDGRSGDPLHSVSSPTVNLRSALFHPKLGAVVKTGKNYTISWKGKHILGADSYTIYFQGNVTSGPFNLGTVSSDRTSARVVLPEGPDTAGYFYLAVGTSQIVGNIVNLK